MRSKITDKEVIGIAFIVLLFIVSALLTREYGENLASNIEGYQWYGALLYVAIATLSVVFAPFNTLFLLPVVVALFGPFNAAILSIFGWTLGALIAYYLARRFGHPFVARFVDTKRFDHIRSTIPEKNIFLWIVLLRISMPVDILSYILGLFVVLPYPLYTLATLIGVTPFAFIFSYAVDISSIASLIAGVLALLALLLGVYWFKKAQKSL